MIRLELLLPASKEIIQEKVQEYRELIKEREEEIRLYLHAITYYQGLCQHEGQTSGYNVRDGHWTTDCTVCGGGGS